MTQIIRVSAVQLNAEMPGRTFSERQRALLRHVREMIETAGRRGTDLALLGEYANVSHHGASQKKSEYIPAIIPGPFTRMVSSLAAKYRMNVALPVLGDRGGVVSSYVVFIDRRGNLTGWYQKTHPTVAEQRLGIRPGAALGVVKLDCCTVGTMICMDIEYPETAQTLMLRGAELLLFPHVQAGWGEADWEVRYRARAIDTGLPLVSASFGYPEGEWRPGKILGRSGVVERDGQIVADMGRSAGVVTCDLDLGRKRVTHFFFEKRFDRTLAVTASRRPELYRPLIESGPGNRARRILKIQPTRKAP